MPRFYIDMFDHIDKQDDTGKEFVNLAAVRRELHLNLAGLLYNQHNSSSSVQLRAHVRDETGKKKMIASLVMTIQELD